MNNYLKSSFTQAFVRLNRLDELGFVRWTFKAGMEFAAERKWWQSAGSRPTPHEGLDICCFENRVGQVMYLTEKNLVPGMFDGTVVNIFEDLLGRSILLAHDFLNTGQRLYSIYAHTVPQKTLQVKSRIKEGEPIATISPTEHMDIRPHLHLSVIRAQEADIADLDWETIHKAHGVTLCNPSDFL